MGGNFWCWKRNFGNVSLYCLTLKYFLVRRKRTEWSWSNVGTREELQKHQHRFLSRELKNKSVKRQIELNANEITVNRRLKWSLKDFEKGMVVFLRKIYNASLLSFRFPNLRDYLV